jgi:YHS domain-containing protein
MEFGKQTMVMRDPVCKMELDETHLRESLVYDGQTYHFCSVGCLAEFRRHPEDYAVTKEESEEREDV